MTNPQELVEQREVIRAKKVRHNRDKRWRSNPDFWRNWNLSIAIDHLSLFPRRERFFGTPANDDYRLGFAA
jgi:hypothetical protein